jgi:transposase InsO family protein
VHIQGAYTASRRTYGAPPLHSELHAQGVAAERHRIARLMRREAIVACTERRFRWTATARAELPAAPDRLRRDFRAGALPRQRRGRKLLSHPQDRAGLPAALSHGRGGAVAIFKYIAAFYNLARRHSSNGYRSPDEHEAQYVVSRT